MKKAQLVSICCAAFFVLGPVLIAAPDDAPEKEALKPLYFRVEVNTDKVYTACVQVESSKEDGQQYDRALIDMDGDGEAEETKSLTPDQRRSHEGYFNMDIPLDIGGMTWSLKLHGSLSDPVKKPVYIDWILSEGGFYAFFINGTVKLYATAEDAARGRAIRLGPPFKFAVRTSERGPDALINIGLKDENDATLRIASTTGENNDRNECNIMLAFPGGTSIEAEYG